MDRATVLIADDEPLARRGLRAVLDRMPRLGEIVECGTGIEAVAHIRARRPSLVLLDVQMPDLNGLGVIERVGVNGMPPVVFVTAYDAFAIRAFEVSAVDYVVKPYTTQRIQGAVERALRVGAERRAAQALQQLLDTLAAGASPRDDGAKAGVPSGGYLQRILAVAGRRAVVTAAQDILWIRADDYCATVVTRSGQSVIRESLNELEMRLDPACFVRVHRSAIVRVDAVRGIERTSAGLHVALSDGTLVPVSRRRAPAVIAALGGYR